MDIGAKLSRVISSTMHDMIDNSIKSNTSLHKAQRKEDKDLDKKTAKTASTASTGVGINAGSVGNEDLSNMGDNRGRSYQEDGFSFENQEEENSDSDELAKSLDFFTKDRIYKYKSQREEIQEEISGEEKFHNKEQKDDEILDKIKDDIKNEEIIQGKEKNLTVEDPKPKKKDSYISSEEEKEIKISSEEEIVIPQNKIKSQGLTIDIEGEADGADAVEIDSENNKFVFDSPSLYEVDEEEEKVSDEIKSSPDYIREQNNRQRVKKMLVHYPNAHIGKLLVDEVYVLGEKILETCLNFGTKILILKQGEKLSDVIPETASIGTLRAGYSEEYKVCFLGEEWLYKEFEEIFRSTTSVYLMGMAFDHAIGGDSFASLKSPFILNNYHSCKRGEEGHQFADCLSSTSPVEYFAQTLESYLQNSVNPETSDLIQKVFEGKICTHEELYYSDISMYQYLDYLLNS